MNTQTIVRRTRIEMPAAEVFRWHARPGALERLLPPWQSVRVLERQGGLEDGARVVLEVRLGPFRRRWVAEQCDYRQDLQFRDRQVEGPFARWDHLHRIEPAGASACCLEDRVEFALPLGGLGALLAGGWVRRELDRTLAYRHRVTLQDLASRSRRQGEPAMHVLVTGSTGLIGSALVPALTTAGHEVTRLVRREPGAGEVRWDPAAGVAVPAALEGLDAVVHLAGESIDGRWTEIKKARIRDSRVEGTRRLSETLAGLDRPPRVLVCASAVGYYGDRGDELLTEESPPGEGFLPRVCQAWEAAAAPAAEQGIRVVHLRFGVVLTPRGGALARMLPPFKLGAGGPLGSGRQYWSWVAIDDAAGAIQHALVTDDLVGPVNVVAPRPVTNQEFTQTLARVLRRPALLPAPAFGLRLALGEMADELLLASARARPVKLEETGYAFRYPELEGALGHLLGV